MQRIFIAGCGYIGSRVALIWKEKGVEVSCLVRTPDKCATLEKQGCNAASLSLDDPADLAPPDMTRAIVYYFVPPPGGGISDTRARNFISLMRQVNVPAKIVYMSATSVYSETGGGVVTEESETAPASAMGKRRLDAERAFLEYGRDFDVPVVILRVSGIYGPGRLPLMQISQGQPLLREEESGPSNRIHADDLSAACVAAAEQGEGIYNVSDGHPSSMTGYFNSCADLLGYPRQPQVTMEEARRVMSPLMLSYISETRIINNGKMLRDLGIALKYPTLNVGLPSCR